MGKVNRATPDEMLTIRPPSLIRGSSFCDSKKTPLKWTFTMESKSAERRYFAVVGGNVEQERFKIDAPIARNKHNRLLMAVDPHGKPAITHIKRIGRSDHGYVIGARLETGRTHQIRVHLTGLGCSVLGDPVYGIPSAKQSKWLALPPTIVKAVESLPGQALHARTLGFRHPMTGAKLAFTAEPPPAFQALLAGLKAFA